MLDLDYIEDSGADADANFVLIEGGQIAEVQATAEGATYDEEGLLRLLRLARIGCDRIFAAQAKAVAAMTTPARLPRRWSSPRTTRASCREIAALLAPYGVDCISAGLARPARAGGDRARPSSRTR